MPVLPIANERTNACVYLRDGSVTSKSAGGGATPSKCAHVAALELTASPGSQLGPNADTATASFA
jgi:hypothetical protein